MCRTHALHTHWPVPSVPPPPVRLEPWPGHLSMPPGRCSNGLERGRVCGKLHCAQHCKVDQLQCHVEQSAHDARSCSFFHSPIVPSMLRNGPVVQRAVGARGVLFSAPDIALTRICNVIWPKVQQTVLDVPVWPGLVFASQSTRSTPSVADRLPAHESTLVPVRCPEELQMALQPRVCAMSCHI